MVKRGGLLFKTWLVLDPFQSSSGLGGHLAGKNQTFSSCKLVKAHFVFLWLSSWFQQNLRGISQSFSVLQSNASSFVLFYSFFYYKKQLIHECLHSYYSHIFHKQHCSKLPQFLNITFQIDFLQMPKCQLNQLKMKN